MHIQYHASSGSAFQDTQIHLKFHGLMVVVGVSVCMSPQVRGKEASLPLFQKSEEMSPFISLALDAVLNPFS